MEIPKCRTENIVMQELNDEVLLYDTASNLAYCLNPPAAVVYKACNGKTTFAEVITRHGDLTHEAIEFALAEFDRCQLLEPADTPRSSMSRRDAMRKLAFGAAAAIPVVSFLVAPPAISALSSLTYFCSNPGAVTSQFCASSPSACDTGAKTQCATCGAIASSSGLCSANPPGANITCTCGGACTNPGAPGGSFCASPSTGCSAARNFCPNCSAVGSTTGICSSNPPGGATLTCTCT